MSEPLEPPKVEDEDEFPEPMPYPEGIPQDDAVNDWEDGANPEIGKPPG